ncbi:UNVERIFIED_CONTAM: hypothetical protein Sindi_0482700 [Sesamum indicum]
MSGTQNLAMQAKDSKKNAGILSRFPQKRRYMTNKHNLKCDERGKTSHLRSSCFEIVGYPDWYKTMMKKRRDEFLGNRVYNVTEPNNQAAASVIETSVDKKMIRSEFQRFLIEKGQAQVNGHTEFENFSGKSFQYQFLNNLAWNSWVIDSGASTHMCRSQNLLENLMITNGKTYVHLADGSRQQVHRTKEVKVVDKVLSKLYILDQDSFKLENLRNYEEQLIHHACKSTLSDLDTWHRRLGHSSHTVLNHTPMLRENKNMIENCKVCPLAKQQRMPLTVSETVSQNLFDLVHVDIWRPYNQESLY